MQLLKDEEGHVVTREVNGVEMPVYKAGNKEEPFDAAAAVAKIKEQAEDLADTEKSSSKELAAVKKSLRAWERIGDMKEVRAAVATVKTLGDGEVDAAELPKKLSELEAERDALQEQLSEANDRITGLDSENYELTVGNEIATAITGMNLIEGFTAAEARALYGEHFKREDGKVIAYKDGKPVMVVEDGSNPRQATVKEALDQFIPKTFRKPSGGNGSDATTPQTSGTHGAIRTKADLKDPVKKGEFIDKYGLEAFQDLPLRAAS